jgi:hypothetical protein
MSAIRDNISGTSPQDIMKINNNFEQMWFKVFGNLNFEDAGNNLKEKISTQWIPVTGEGNLDTNYPMYIRFYVPPNTKKIKSTSFNFMLDRYRMDSSITDSAPSLAVASSTTTSTQPTSTQSSSATTTISSASSAPSQTASSTVNVWGNLKGQDVPTAYANGDVVIAPSHSIQPGDNGLNWESKGDYFVKTDYGFSYAGISLSQNVGMFSGYYLDLYTIQHQHNVTIPSHSHDMTASPHSHTVEIPPHNHTVTIELTVPGHHHDLVEGIKVSSNAPSTTGIYINDNLLFTLFGDGATRNEVDVKDYLQIGAWNTFKITGTSVARITLYGIIELVQNFF